MKRLLAGLLSINLLALPLGGAAAAETPAQTPGRSVAALGASYAREWSATAARSRWLREEWTGESAQMASAS